MSPCAPQTIQDLLATLEVPDLERMLTRARSDLSRGEAELARCEWELKLVEEAIALQKQRKRQSLTERTHE